MEKLLELTPSEQLLQFDATLLIKSLQSGSSNQDRTTK